MKFAATLLLASAASAMALYEQDCESCQYGDCYEPEYDYYKTKAAYKSPVHTTTWKTEWHPAYETERESSTVPHLKPRYDLYYHPVVKTSWRVDYKPVWKPIYTPDHQRLDYEQKYTRWASAVEPTHTTRYESKYHPVYDISYEKYEQPEYPEHYKPGYEQLMHGYEAEEYDMPTHNIYEEGEYRIYPEESYEAAPQYGHY